MAQRHSIIGDVRGLGLILGVELLRDRQMLVRATDEAERVMYAALSEGLNFKVTMGNILTLTPPLTLTREELNRALQILDAAIGSLKSPEL
jgi:4-aminobutyrate aminotransferase